jgi:hypothetical protein
MSHTQVKNKSVSYYSAEDVLQGKAGNSLIIPKA